MRPGDSEGHIDNQEHTALSHSPPGKCLCCSPLSLVQTLHHSGKSEKFFWETVSVIFNVVNPKLLDHVGDMIRDKERRRLDN